MVNFVPLTCATRKTFCPLNAASVINTFVLITLVRRVIIVLSKLIRRIVMLLFAPFVKLALIPMQVQTTTKNGIFMLILGLVKKAKLICKNNDYFNKAKSTTVKLISARIDLLKLVDSNVTSALSRFVLDIVYLSHITVQAL